MNSYPEEKKPVHTDEAEEIFDPVEGVTPITCDNAISLEVCLYADAAGSVRYLFLQTYKDLDKQIKQYNTTHPEAPKKMKCPVDMSEILDLIELSKLDKAQWPTEKNKDGKIVLISDLKKLQNWYTQYKKRHAVDSMTKEFIARLMSDYVCRKYHITRFDDEKDIMLKTIKELDNSALPPFVILEESDILSKKEIHPRSNEEIISLLQNERKNMAETNSYHLLKIFNDLFAKLIVDRRLEISNPLQAKSSFFNIFRKDPDRLTQIKTAISLLNELRLNRGLNAFDFDILHKKCFEHHKKYWQSAELKLRYGSRLS